MKTYRIRDGFTVRTADEKVHEGGNTVDLEDDEAAANLHKLEIADPKAQAKAEKEEAKRKADEEAARVAAEEEETKRKADEDEAARVAAEEAAKPDAPAVDGEK